MKRWEEGSIGDSRESWFRVFRIPYHVWKSEFVVELVESWGKFICVDERTTKEEAFDVARIIVKIKLDFRTPDLFPVNIDGKVNKLTIREGAWG